MGSGLKVIALISGGKDSLYSILHCLANGHSIVALANLHPPLSVGSDITNAAEHEDEDVDSYMYQTVGHSIISLYERALQVPLYREQIRGGAANRDKDYAPTSSPNADEPDETESLVPLLKNIIAKHPGVNAVSTGAILSTYQRTRVESVAIRLSLTPLSYLWQYPLLPPYTQSSLLDDMRNAGQDSRIVKVASGGLDQRFLWENVTDLRVVQRLKTVMSRFGGGNGAVLGEGGEYETLALDGPSVLWKHRIEVDEHEDVPGEGGSAAVRIRSARTVQKDLGAVNLDSVRIPSILDTEFQELFDSTNDLRDFSKPYSLHMVEPQPLDILPQGDCGCKKTIGDIILFSNWQGVPDTSPEEQLMTIIKNIDEAFKQYYHKPKAVSCVLLLRSMADFTTLNPIYGAMFTRPNPPSRVTVACGDRMPKGIHVMLSLVFNRTRQKLRGLHVQGRSYWAPANIGPYSQAISVPLKSLDRLSSIEGSEQHVGDASTDDAEFVYIAGQIALVPASMELITVDQMARACPNMVQSQFSGFQAQSVLALQHLWRIGRAVNVVCWTGAVAFLSSCEQKVAETRKSIAQHTWRSVQEHLLASNATDEESLDDDVDVWDLINVKRNSTHTDEYSRPALPDFKLIRDLSTNDRKLTPCFVVEVDQLPRGADIEWASSGFTGCQIQLSAEHINGCVLHTIHAIEEGFTVIWASVGTIGDLDRASAAIQSCQFWTGNERHHMTVYTVDALPEPWFREFQPLTIPSRRLWAADGSECKAILMVRCFNV